MPTSVASWSSIGRTPGAPSEHEFFGVGECSPSAEHRVELVVQRRRPTGTPGEVDLVDARLGGIEIGEVIGDDGLALRGPFASKCFERRSGCDAAPEPERDVQGVLDDKGVEVVWQVASRGHGRTRHHGPGRSNGRPGASAALPTKRHHHVLLGHVSTLCRARQATRLDSEAELTLSHCPSPISCRDGTAPMEHRVPAPLCTRPIVHSDVSDDGRRRIRNRDGDGALVA